MTYTPPPQGEQRNSRDHDAGGLVSMAAIETLAAGRFILDTGSLPIELRIESRDPLIVSIKVRTGPNTSRRTYWTPPAAHHDQMHALGTLMWHLDEPRRARWLPALGERLGQGGE